MANLVKPTMWKPWWNMKAASTSEIKSLLEYNNASNNELLKSILYSKKDYVVDCRTLSESEPEVGGELADLPVDRGIIDCNV